MLWVHTPGTLPTDRCSRLQGNPWLWLLVTTVTRGTGSEAGNPPLPLHADRVQGERHEVIVADQHGELDQLTLVVAAGERGPCGVGDRRAVVQLVGGPQQSPLEGVP